MIARIIKYSILNVLFLIYFIIYAMSPLSYSLTEKQLYEPISSQTKDYGKTFSLVFLEFLESNIIKQRGVENSSSAVRFLLHKKGAILPSNILAKTSTTIKDYTLSSSNIVLPLSLFRASATKNNKPGSFKDFQLSHSGLSPPLSS